MSRKFVPTEEELAVLISEYRRTGSMAKAGLAIGISRAVAQRVLNEELGDEVPAPKKRISKTTPEQDVFPYTYKGETPEETVLPTKNQFYWDLIQLMEEQRNVSN